MGSEQDSDEWWLLQMRAAQNFAKTREWALRDKLPDPTYDRKTGGLYHAIRRRLSKCAISLAGADADAPLARVFCFRNEAFKNLWAERVSV